MANLTGSSTAEIDAPLDQVWALVEDVERVVEIVDRAGLAARVVRLRPIGVVKG